MRYCRLHSCPVDRTTGLRSDQIITLTGRFAAQDYPDNCGACVAMIPSGA